MLTKINDKQILNFKKNRVKKFFSSFIQSRKFVPNSEKKEVCQTAVNDA